MGFVVYSAICFIYASLFFIVAQKPAFGIYNRPVGKGAFTHGDIADIYRHGVVSDFIVASYVTALPLLISAIHTLLPIFNLYLVLTVCAILISLTVGLACVADTLLYRFWGYKLDASALVYLRSLKGTFASVSSAYIVGAILLWLICASIFFAGMQLLTLVYCRHAANTAWLPWWGYPIAIFALALCIGALFIIIRGLKIRPNNPSVVYFSKNPFLNHWALNPIYNFIYSLSTKDEFKGKFHYFDTDECAEISKQLFPTEGQPKRKLLNTDRPNILLVIWESLGAEFTGSLGSRPEVSENFDRIARDGVLFTHCTASSFRTDRGLPAIIGGLPGQPTTSIIRYTRKLPSLPSLVRRLRNEGYATTAVHGGELTIMHKSDYYLSSGHDRLISQSDLPKTAPVCKWGIHDGYMFDFVFDDIIKQQKQGRRWFTTLQTLSSHEPFNVPYDRLKNDKIGNAFAYTDKCFGQFIDKLKQSPAWDETLVIVVADHGLNTTDSPASRSEYAHIPLLLTGGAVTAKARIDTIMSQSDIAATILGQLGLSHDEFPFSRDILADTYIYPCSIHTFNNGFMFTDGRGVTIVDNVQDKAIEGTDPQRERNGRATLQKLYEYIADL